MKSITGSGKQLILWLPILSVILVMMGCASGIQKTSDHLQNWKIDEEVIKSVKENCSPDFKPATSGTIAGLWENKRLILRQSRACSRAANTLAEQAENRNKVIGE
jgi:hypothetical protein